MPRQWVSRAPVAVGTTVILVLNACGPDLPSSVVEGSVAKVGWEGDLTSLNAATRDGATPGNIDVAAVTRSRFARLTDRDVVIEEDFGSVEVVDDGVDSFTVRYDLAEPKWSDGIAVDAADLMLAWAAGSDALAPEQFAPAPSDLAHSAEVPEYDEFERSIDVVYDRPVRDWQTTLDVAVPAHVVGELALGIEDPMEAKQAVIDAIQKEDESDLGKLAEIWNTGFDLDDGDIAEHLRVSSGPYRVESVDRAESGIDKVTLVANAEFVGKGTPTYERIELAAASESERLAEIGHEFDAVQLAPTAENWPLIRDLERRDFGVATAHDGTLWTLMLRADRGTFRQKPARLAFLRAVPLGDLKDAGGGRWRNDYTSTRSLLFSPSSPGYSMSQEDAGFRETFEDMSSDAAEERTRAGVPPRTPVCVLHDVDEAFARAAYAELKAAVAEAGWLVQDCGAKDVDRAARRDGRWHAALIRIDLPSTPREIAEQWGSRADFSLSGMTNPKRDELIEQLAQTPDKYDARYVRVAIEAQLVDEAIAVPLAMNPVVTLSSRDIENVQPESGWWAPLMSTATRWSPSD